MNGLSKAIGGFLGFLLAGPGGCLLGILIGHIFDRQLIYSRTTHQQHAEHDAATRHIFFETTFLVMGYLAKLNGRVSEATIQKARGVMQQMQLDASQRQQAMQWFNEGKQPHFSLKSTLQRLTLAGQYDQFLIQRFLDIQTQVAFADGNRLSHEKQQALETIYRILGFSLLQSNWFDPFIEATAQSYIFNEHYHDTSGYRTQHNTQSSYHSTAELKEACQVLNLSPQATHDEAKKAYRRLMSQYHPDKLASQGLSQTQLKKANEKTQRIKAAYDKICKLKGFS